MLGRSISDPEGAEADPGTEIAGMGLLDVDTVFRGEKIQAQTTGTFGPVPGPLAGLEGLRYRATRSIWAGAARGCRLL